MDPSASCTLYACCSDAKPASAPVALLSNGNTAAALPAAVTHGPHGSPIQPLDGPLHTDDAIALSRAASGDGAAPETPLPQDGPAEHADLTLTAVARPDGQTAAGAQQQSVPRKGACEQGVWVI